MDDRAKLDVIKSGVEWYRKEHGLSGGTPITADAPNRADGNGTWRVSVNKHGDFPGATIGVPIDKEPFEMFPYPTPFNYPNFAQISGGMPPTHA